MPDENATASPVWTVKEIVLAFLDYAEKHYSDRRRKQGKSAEGKGSAPCATSSPTSSAACW
jgi:hypothetical protein